MHLIYTLQQYTLYIITVYIIYYNNIHIITLYKKIQIYTSNKNLNKHYKLKLANHATATQYINHYHCSVAAYVVTQMNQTPTHKIQFNLFLRFNTFSVIKIKCQQHSNLKNAKCSNVRK